MFICQNWHPCWDDRREFGHMILIMILKSLSCHIFLDFNTLGIIYTNIINYKAKNKGFIF